MEAPKTMNVIVSRVDSEVFDGSARSLVAPGVEGELTILPEHEPFITPLKKGIVRLETETGVTEVHIDRGVLEISGNQVTILT